MFKASGKCYACSDETARTSTQEECHACSNRVWNGLTSQNCQNCSVRKFRISKTTDDYNPQEECNRCSDRTLISNGHSENYLIYCVKNCTSPDEFLDANGNCATCDNETVYQGWHGNGAEFDPFEGIIARCRACPTLVPGYYTNSSCRQCDNDAQQIPMYVATIEEAKAQCDKCPNRTFIASYADIRHGPVFHCSRKCAGDEILDASGECKNCSSNKIGLPDSPVPEVYGHSNEIKQYAQECGNFVQSGRTLYNYTSDISDVTFTISNNDCKTYWKGRRYVSTNWYCTLCPEKNSEAWNSLTEEQREQCTPD